MLKSKMFWFSFVTVSLSPLAIRAVLSTPEPVPLWRIIAVCLITTTVNVLGYVQGFRNRNKAEPALPNTGTVVRLDFCGCQCHSPILNFRHGPLSACCGTCNSCGFERQTRAHMIECHRIRGGDHK